MIFSVYLSRGYAQEIDVKNVMVAQTVKSRICFIRGQRVMLDRDLAELYGVETRVLNQAVRRNRERFPPDFMMQLTRTEIMRISQFVISSQDPRSSIKFSKRVFSFTEQGVAMLSSVLASKRAVAVNIAIMRTFVRLRQVLSTNAVLAKRLEAIEHRLSGYGERFDQHASQIKEVFDAIRSLMDRPVKSVGKIGFKGLTE